MVPSELKKVFNRMEYAGSGLFNKMFTYLKLIHSVTPGGSFWRSSSSRLLLCRVVLSQLPG